MNPRIERARIQKAIRDCQRHGFPILEPEECIKQAVERFGDSLAVSCSFGSCSVVVLHMALKFKPDIKVVFCNTGVEYPETYAYRDLLEKEWNLNLIETKPIKSFWQCVKEYGFPLMRTAYSYKKRKGIKTRFHKPECCIYLKELPVAKACKDYGIEAMLTGLRAAESLVRMYTISQRGMFYHTQKWASLWRFHPLAFWTRQQVWDYIKEHDIPINQVYLKGVDRSGCMPCTGFKNWEQQLAKTNPRMYRYVQKLRGVTLIEDFIALENEVADRCGCFHYKEDS